jgi:CubicO group peptidase (beta-lactamase class C family)
MIRPEALAAMAILLGFVPAPGQQPSTAQAILRLDGSSLTPTEIDASVRQFMKASNVTGVGIAVFHDGKICYLKAHGQSDTQRGLMITPDSVMAAASLSKAAFATVVMKLVQNGYNRERFDERLGDDALAC